MAVERFDPTDALLKALMENVQAPRYDKPAPVQPGYTPSAYTQGLFGQLNRDPSGMQLVAAPSLTMGQRNPAVPMGAGLAQLGGTGARSMFSAPQMSPQPAPQQYAAAPPMPPQRPADLPAMGASNAGPVPMPPQRPANPGAEMGPGAFEGIKGFNPFASAGNAQAYADQFAGGDLSKLAARTYRNDDGTSWNDYYLANSSGA